MKKLFAGFLLALIVLLPSVVSANTDEVHWDLTGYYEIDFVCTSGCSGTYPHIMDIDYMNMDTKEFSGTGTDSHTWTVTGNISGCSDIAFTIDYDSSAYYVDVEGTISDDGSMSGTWNNPTQAGYWETTSGTAIFQRYAEITTPEEDEIVYGSVDFGAYLVDNDYDYVDWAVRKGTCAQATNTVFGNVDGFTDSYDWAYDSGTCYTYNFMTTADTCAWDASKYCFIFNPREDLGEANIRLTRWFYVADGRVSGGGQIIEEMGEKQKDWYKISFGGGIWDVGSEGYMGEWEVNFHNVSDESLDKTKFHTTDIDVINFYPPSSDTCVAAMNFTAYGEWNGVPGYKLIFRSGDADSPKGLDTVRIELYNPSNVEIYDTHGGDFTDESSCVGEARTGLDNGNIKIDFCP
ncbi:MAG: hypothetical protein WBA71_07160 [Candidatus Humimicrobiia bacterium]